MNTTSAVSYTTPEQIAAAMPTDVMLAIIERQQTIQKQHRPGSQLLNNASEVLAPLFAEMARRQGAAS